MPRALQQALAEDRVILISDEVRSGLKAWYSKASVPRKCGICGQQFLLSKLPYWIYFGADGECECCFRCAIVQSPKKAELPGLIRGFIEASGFIPHADAGPINRAFTTRLGRNRLRTFEAFGAMGGIDHVKRKFGTWFEGLALSRVLPDGVLITPRGVRCLAADGHVCHSLDEQAIDNWLSANGVPHDREPFYPKDPVLNQNGRRRADWAAGECFIEYFGLVGDPQYDKKIEEKTLLAARSHIPLLAIYPSDLARLPEKLGCLLEEE